MKKQGRDGADTSALGMTSKERSGIHPQSGQSIAPPMVTPMCQAPVSASFRPLNPCAIT